MLCTNIKAEFADAEAGCIYNKIEQLLYTARSNIRTTVL